MILLTYGPQDLVGVINESFTIIVAKKIQELTLKVLKVYKGRKVFLV